MSQENRVEWLSGLFENQLRALGSQHKISGALFLSRKELIKKLSEIEGVELGEKG